MSYLATLERDGDEYVKDGVHVGDWELALGDALGFCGCGAPLDALAYVWRILKALDMPSPDSLFASGERAAWSTWYAERYRPALDAIFHGDTGAEYLAYYLLSDKGLTEHGGSVPGWLTQRGKDVLSDLNMHADELLSARPTP